MNTNGEAFLARWSRLKRSGGDVPETTPAVAQAAPVAPATPKAPLPDPERLGFDDDFTAFLGREVEERVKRAAMKKLFHSPHFNVMDGLDIYIDDYTVPSPLDETTLRSLAHARDMLFDGQTGLTATGAAGDEHPATTAALGEDDRQTSVPAANASTGATHGA